MDSQSLWQKAVLNDGSDVMYEVTARLYPGNLPPKYILKKEDYYKVFNSSQRVILESSEENCTFDIYSVAKKFDITFHYAVQKFVCGLQSREGLFKHVKSFVEKRNKLAHSPYGHLAIEEDLNEELDDLLCLYMDILTNLEFETEDTLTAQKKRISDSIESKKIKNKDESSGMSDFTKVAVGVGVAGAVGIGLGALIGAFLGEKEDKRKK